MSFYDKYLNNLEFNIATNEIEYHVNVANSLLSDLNALSYEVKLNTIKKIKYLAYNLKNHLNKEFIKELINHFESCTNEEFQIELILTLGFIGNIIVIPILRKWFLEIDNLEIKKACAYALGELRITNIASILINAIKQNNDEELQDIILDALLKINDSESAIELLEACKNASINIKLKACGFLCKLNISQGFEYIKRALNHQLDEIKLKALTIALNYPNETFLEPIINIILKNNTNDELIISALNYLSKLPNLNKLELSLIDKIIDITNHPNENLRSIAILAIGSIAIQLKQKNEDISYFLEILTNKLKDENKDVVINTLNVLSELKAPTVVPKLLDIIDSPILEIKLATLSTVRSLAYWIYDIENKNKLTYALMSLMSDPNPLVRAISVEALGYLENPESIEALLNILNDDDDQVKANAIAALGNFNKPEIIESLLPFLTHENVIIKWNTLMALTKIGDKSLIGPISRLLSDPDELIRQTAKNFIDSFSVDLNEQK